MCSSDLGSSRASTRSWPRSLRRGRTGGAQLCFVTNCSSSGGTLFRSVSSGWTIPSSSMRCVGRHEVEERQEALVHQLEVGRDRSEESGRAGRRGAAWLTAPVPVAHSLGQCRVGGQYPRVTCAASVVMKSRTGSELPCLNSKAADRHPKRTERRGVGREGRDWGSC